MMDLLMQLGRRSRNQAYSCQHEKIVDKVGTLEGFFKFMQVAGNELSYSKEEVHRAKVGTRVYM